MKAEGHEKRAEEPWHAIEKLLDDPEEDVVAIVELSSGMCHHLIAYGMEQKHERHRDTHAGVIRPLRERGETEVANAFEMPGTLRQGRFYGGRGNGPTVKRALELIDKIKRWALS